MKLMKILALVPVAAVVVAFSSSREAHAQPKKKIEVLEIGEVKIYARPTRPSAVVELGKILPEIEIAKIRQPFISKIEEAITGEPF
jgi:hypothetical protein